MNAIGLKEEAFYGGDFTVDYMHMTAGADGKISVAYTFFPPPVAHCFYVEPTLPVPFSLLRSPMREQILADASEHERQLNAVEDRPSLGDPLQDFVLDFMCDEVMESDKNLHESLFERAGTQGVCSSDTWYAYSGIRAKILEEPRWSELVARLKSATTTKETPVDKSTMQSLARNLTVSDLLRDASLPPENRLIRDSEVLLAEMAYRMSPWRIRTKEEEQRKRWGEDK